MRTLNAGHFWRKVWKNYWFSLGAPYSCFIPQLSLNSHKRKVTVKCHKKDFLHGNISSDNNHPLTDMLDDISPPLTILWDSFGCPGIQGYVEIADEHAKEGSARHFVGPEPAFGVSMQSIRRKIHCWLDRRHLMRWRFWLALWDRLESWSWALVLLPRPR
jgi:hypothetical protein